MQKRLSFILTRRRRDRVAVAERVGGDVGDVPRSASSFRRRVQVICGRLHKHVMRVIYDPKLGYTLHIHNHN
jgi:hypothetical protein